MNEYELNSAFDRLKETIKGEFRSQEVYNASLRMEIARLTKKVDDLEKKLDWLIKGNLSDGEIQRLLDEA